MLSSASDCPADKETDGYSNFGCYPALARQRQPRPASQFQQRGPEQPQIVTVADNGVTTRTDNNFDTAGNLVRFVDVGLQSTTRADCDNHRIALAALKEFQSGNQNVLLKPCLMKP